MEHQVHLEPMEPQVQVELQVLMELQEQVVPKEQQVLVLPNGYLLLKQLWLIRVLDLLD